MDAALQEPVGEELERVGQINSNAARIRLDRSLAVLPLSHIFERGVLLRGSMVILHISQVAVAPLVITVLLEKKVLWQF